MNRDCRDEPGNDEGYFSIRKIILDSVTLPQ
jgi:hypothetical protein